MGSTFKVLLFNLFSMEAGESLKRFLKDKEAAKKHRRKLKYEQFNGDHWTKVDEGEAYGIRTFLTKYIDSVRTENPNIYDCRIPLKL